MYMEDVVMVDFIFCLFMVLLFDWMVKVNSVIVVTGATAKRFGIFVEATLWSRGISVCVICDGVSLIFKGEEVVVVGGGDIVMEEVVYLIKYVKYVYLFVRGSTMRVSKVM